MVATLFMKAVVALVGSRLSNVRYLHGDVVSDSVSERPPAHGIACEYELYVVI
jgi:hypothetical protein